MPCYNGARTIAIQLSAIAVQEWSEPWELIVVDNRSSDGTATIAEQYRDRLPALRIVDASDRQGSAHARNVGVRAAAADRLVFCDVDDMVEPGWVAAMGEALAGHDFVASSIALDKLNEPAWRAVWQDPPPEGLPLCHDFLPAASGCGFGFTRRLHERVGLFDESLRRLSDIEYSWRAQLLGAKIHLVPEAIVQYRYVSSPKGLFRLSFNDTISALQLYRKYRSVGMSPPQSFKGFLGSCYGLLRSVPMRHDQAAWGKWMVSAGSAFGWLWGSFAVKMSDSSIER
jgi:glycosyltransferase involved in cell wall biosynthesis